MAPQKEPQKVLMPAARPLTDTQLRNLKGNGERYELPDPGAPGLALRVSAKGQKTWTVVYRVRGSGEVSGERVAKLAGGKRRLTLGEYPSVGLADARAKAAEIKRLARSGIDAGDNTGNQEDSQTSVPVVAELIDRYVSDHLRRNGLRAGSNAEKQLRLHVSGAWSTKPVVSITRADLVLLLEKVRIPFEVEVRDGDKVELRKRGGPGAAAEVRKWTRAMFQFAVEAGLLPDNPFADVKNRDKQRSRDRVLSMPELAAVWEAAGAMGYPWGPYYRLILLTGDRRGEWAKAQWHWLDGERERLEIPAAQYKTGKAQVVPLSSQARAIIREMPRGDLGPFLFSSDGGATPVSGFSKAKARLERHLAKAGHGDMAPWVVHDLRRSMATHMERIGVPPHVIEVCLGHVLKGVAGTYRHYGYLPQKTAALQDWADELLAGVAADV